MSISLERYSRWKYTILLAAMLLLLAVRVATERLEVTQFMIDACVAFVVIAALLVACTHRKSRITALILGIPVLVLSVIARFDAPNVAQPVFIALRATMAIFLGFTILVIMLELLSQSEITRDTLSGAFCGYVIIGIAWTELYCLVDMAAPNSFRVMVESLPRSSIDGRWHMMQYFSFVTLSTLGYGDVLPASPVARTLACMEAVCGQFYLAVLVAGLVNVRFGQSSAASKPHA